MGTKRRPLPSSLELDVMKLCRAVDAECLERGMTRLRMIEELGVDPTTWYSWRRGEYGMNASALLRIVAWLDLDRELRRFARQKPARVPADPLPGSRGRAALDKPEPRRPSNTAALYGLTHPTDTTRIRKVPNAVNI
jgi:transcriptional regulator with XRE-family HTH domain